MNISYTGPEIWYVTDVIIFQFGPFLSFYHPLTAHAWQTEFFVISDNFLSIYPLKTQKLKFWKNEKNAWKYYHFTQVYQKLGSCYTVPEVGRHGCNCYFSFWTYFCLFTPITAWKMKISKKWKKHLQMSSFYTCVPKIMIIWYTVPEIWHVTDVIVTFHFGLFFALLPL